ncbi:MAG: hypothetical protein Q9219_001425 [cf. Caloplaca sp. 3 TL-2023]
MPPKGMTANPVKPSRYRPGKPTVEDPPSEDDYETEEEEEEPNQTQQSQRTGASHPKASSFPADAAKIANNLRNVDLNERRRKAAAEEVARFEAEKAVRAKEEEGFATEESDESEAGESSEESEGDTEESSSEDEAPRKLLRPTFIKKDKRKDNDSGPTGKTEEELWAEQQAERKAKATAMIQEQLDKDAVARAAGKKDWDDDEDVDADEVDDTDDIDPETERAAWKLRELKRVKRDREAIEQAEKEREEVERRRNLTKEERDAEDKVFLEQQKEEKEGKGKMGYMQKYFHKGAFFQDDAKAEGLDRRDIMGSRYQDDVVNRELLPQYMQIRDMTRLGRKGRTKYKDLKTEDTGRWGQFDNKGPRKDYTLDERFQPDRDGGGRGPTGANSTAVGARPRAPANAPLGPRASTATARREEDKGEPAAPARARRPPSPRRRSYSRSKSPPSQNVKGQRSKRRSYSRSRSPPPRRISPDYRRRRSYSRSRSPSPRRDRYRDYQSRRKRSPSPYHDRYEADKRRRIGVR